MCLGFQAKGEESCSYTRTRFNAIGSLAVKRETALDVRVAKGGCRPGRGHETRQGLLGGENLFVLVLPTAMNEDDPIGIEWAGGEIPQIAQIFRAKLTAGPFNCRARHGIEIFYIGDTAHRFIVITAYVGAHKRTDALHNFVWVGPIPDDIAQAYSALPEPRASL